MKNFVQPGHMITVAAPLGGVIGGAPVLIDHLFGIAATTQDAGEPVELATVGVYALVKATGAVTVGQVAYFDESEGVVTTTSDTDANARIGVFAAAAAEAAATALVKLDGSAS
jgi:predicted RecA/RadA family phage recombinase